MHFGLMRLFEIPVMLYWIMHCK